MKKLSLIRPVQRIRAVPGLGRNVLGLVILASVGVLALVIILNGQRFTPPWEDRFVFAAEFTEVPAVNPSQKPKVRIAGVEVGQVTDSEVTPDGNAKLTFAIEPNHTIYDDARLVLRPKNALNEMYVEVNPGGRTGKPLPENGVIPLSQTERPVQPDEIFSHLDTRTREALGNLLEMSDVALAHAPEHLPEGLNAVNATAAQFKPLLEKLETRRENIRQLVTALSRITAAVGGNQDRLTVLADSLQQTLGTLAQRNSELQASLEQLPGTTGELRTAMTGLKKLTGELNPTLDNLGRASERLPSTLHRVSGLVDKVDQTIRSAQPVVSRAGPVVRDLRPIVSDLHGTLRHLEPVARDLDPVTATLVPYLNDLMAFTYNTSSVFSVADANGGLVRGHVAIPLPDGGVIPGAHGGNTFPNSQGRQGPK